MTLESQQSRHSEGQKANGRRFSSCSLCSLTSVQRHEAAAAVAPFSLWGACVSISIPREQPLVSTVAQRKSPLCFVSIPLKSDSALPRLHPPPPQPREFLPVELWFLSVSQKWKWNLVKEKHCFKRILFFETSHLNKWWNCTCWPLFKFVLSRSQHSASFYLKDVPIIVCLIDRISLFFSFRDELVRNSDLEFSNR